MDLIYKHDSNGELHQSGAMEIPGIAKSLNVRGYIHAPFTVKGLVDLGFSTLVLTGAGFQPAIERGNDDELQLEVIHIPFHDKEDLEDHRIARIEKMILPTAKKLADQIRQGNKVLSTCWAGVNRSSLLTAFTLKELLPDADGRDVVSMIRQNRSERCLNNKLFEQIVIHGF